MSDDFQRIVFEVIFYDGPAAMMLRKHGNGQFTLSKHGYSDKMVLSPAELGCIKNAIKAAEASK